ncbi:hypothetical protein PR048_021675 [Dryococelus australis]|uniref:EF-hand domain-containing protein n=1 Tax=Dryococelus australis TaxID=614101 RepID=A0ABQ9GZ28_9NEOP|nr:hypothetical protein PR048_021675 [Dryococelus australis]
MGVAPVCKVSKQETFPSDASQLPPWKTGTKSYKTGHAVHLTEESAPIHDLFHHGSEQFLYHQITWGLQHFITLFLAQEWVSKRIPPRPIMVTMDPRQKQLQVLTQSGQLLRALDLSHSEQTSVFKITDGLHIVIRTKNDYDLGSKMEIFTQCWGHGGLVARLLISYLGELGSIPCRVAPRFSHVQIEPDDAADLPFPPPFHSGTAPYLPHFTLISSQDLNVYPKSLHSHSPNVLCFDEESYSVLKFNSQFLREIFLEAFETYVTKVGITREYITMPLQAALKQIITQKDRQKKLEMFFRVVFAQAFEIPHSEDELLKTDENASKEIIYTEITKTEFAEALSMKRDSEFIEKIFALVDKDQNGFVSFREFLDMLIIFAKGSKVSFMGYVFPNSEIPPYPSRVTAIQQLSALKTKRPIETAWNSTPDDKAQLMFDMYDINKTRHLTKDDFKHMISDGTGGSRLAPARQNNLVATDQQLPSPEDLGPIDRSESLRPAMLQRI